MPREELKSRLALTPAPQGPATNLERLLEDISFAGPENAGRAISIGVEDVRAALADLVRDEDLSRYVL